MKSGGFKESAQGLYTKSKILKFGDKIKLELATFGYDYVEKLLPKKVMSLFDTFNHKYNTKNKEAPVINMASYILLC